MKSVHLLPHQLTDRLQPQDIGQRLTSVQRLEIDGQVTLATENEEFVAVVIKGSLDFTAGNHSGSAVFRDMIYLPRHSTMTLTSEEPAVAMGYWVPVDRDTAFAHLRFSDVDADPDRHHVYGDAAIGSERDVWDVIDGNFDSQRMLVGMSVGRPGGWTAWPPHEHTAEREETYVYFDMGDAFGIQCVYEDGQGMDEPLNVALVREGHLVSVPGGFHPSVGCPAGPISYIYFMASHVKDERNFMDLRIQQRYGEKFD